MKENITAYHQTKEQIEKEQLLIEEAKKDSLRFAVLYERYYEQIFLFVLKRLESEQRAADIVSQVFLKALINLPKYRDMGLPFSSWLFRIARNELYDLQTQSKIQMVVSIDTKVVSGMVHEIGDVKEDHGQLYFALEQLDEDEIELIELRFFEQRAFKEIGEILSITENNAKVRTYRVLDKLKKHLINKG